MDVPLTTSWSAAASAAVKSSVKLVTSVPAEVVDGGRVGAAEGLHVDRLDAARGP